MDRRVRLRIGDAEAIVILEPDGLGIIPWYKQFRGMTSEAAGYEWCQPAEASEASAANERFAMLNAAAGQWFPDMALQLARNAVPGL